MLFDGSSCKKLDIAFYTTSGMRLSSEPQRRYAPADFPERATVLLRGGTEECGCRVGPGQRPAHPGKRASCSRQPQAAPIQP
jgi:hypothetical protein